MSDLNNTYQQLKYELQKVRYSKLSDLEKPSNEDDGKALIELMMQG